MKHLKHWLAVTTSVLLLLAAAGCDYATGVDNPNVVLTTDRTSYSHGEEGTLTLTNRHRSRLGVNRNLCLAGLQVREGDDWGFAGTLGIPHSDDGTWRACPLPLSFVRRGDSHSGNFVVDGRFESGREYRFVVAVEEYDTGRRSGKFSNTFRISEGESAVETFSPGSRFRNASVP